MTRGNLAVIAFVASMPGALPAFATGTAAQTFPWQDENTYRRCEHTCLYSKAKENYSFLALYITRRLQKLREYAEAGQQTDIREMLGAYCLPFASESANQCLQRYARFEGIRLTQIRKALIDLDTNISKIPVIEGGGIPGQENHRAVVPHLPTFDELKAEYEAQTRRMNTFSSQEYERWVEGVPHEPSRADFVKFREIPRNPDDPTGPKLTVADTSCGRAICYDDAAYNSAIAEYRARRDDVDEDFENMRGADPTPSRRATMEVADLDADDKQAILDARGAMVDAANRAMIEGTPDPTQYTDFVAARRLAGAAATDSPLAVPNPSDPAAVAAPARRAATDGHASPTAPEPGARRTYDGSESVLETRAGSPSTPDAFVSMSESDLTAAFALAQELAFPRAASGTSGAVAP